MSNELKPCPCDECNKRKAYARTFGAYFYGDDCPYRCTAYERYKGQKGKTMSRYIDADALREEWLYENGTFEPNDVLDSIDCQPTVDAVSVEWIKRYIEQHENAMKSADGIDFFIEQSKAKMVADMLNEYRVNEYCADGERKEE